MWSCLCLNECVLRVHPHQISVTIGTLKHLKFSIVSRGQFIEANDMLRSGVVELQHGIRRCFLRISIQKVKFRGSDSI